MLSHIRWLSLCHKYVTYLLNKYVVRNDTKIKQKRKIDLTGLFKVLSCLFKVFNAWFKVLNAPFKVLTDPFKV